jgi:hypothetical protein
LSIFNVINLKDIIYGLVSFTVKKTLDSSLSDEKKSFILSALVYLIIILILFLIRFWPPSNIKELIGGGGGGGIEMNLEIVIMV